MASVNKKLKANVPGDFFVDSSCINCDACRQIAPENFSEEGEFSVVGKQPENKEELAQAWYALLSCPVGAIGSSGENKSKEYQQDFPLHIDNDVYFCGNNARASYGANSYLIKSASGNWLIDSPSYQKSLVKRIAELGGIKYIFLTHQDDVADADRYAAEFNSCRIIHEHDLQAQKDAEIVLKGLSDQMIEPGFLIIPTPGHTRGHLVLLYKNCYLFSGDHLAWDRDAASLQVFKDYCWYSFAEQKESVKKLLNYEFSWLLPGHGQRIELEKSEMKKKLQELCAAL